MKARYRPYHPEEGYFTLIDPEEIKKHNPLLKAIDSFVEEHISVEPFSQSIKNETEGAPAVHPRMMLKVIFYSYAQGVYSSREMEDRMRWDPNYIYLSANQRVDHSTICNFILKYGDEIKAAFSRLVYVMAKMGYITMDFVAIDGTKIKANAGMKFTGDVEDFRRQRDRIKRKIEQILHHTTEEEPEGKARREKKLGTLEREKAKIESFLTEVDKEDKPPKGKVSLTDRDARMVKDKDSKYMGYNCQMAVDDESHAIVGAEVFNEASDRGLLQPMIEEIRGRSGENLTKTDISADAGYFSSDNIRYCHEQGLDVYLPEGAGEGGVRQWQGDLIRGRDCRMEIDGDIKRLTCPGGQIMETLVAKEDRGSYFYRFRPDAAVCRDCALRARCYRNKSTYRDFRIKKEYFETLSLRARMTEKLSSEHGKKRMRGRSCLIEHVFGEIKEIFRFRRLAYRGLEKVRLIWQLVCIGYNLRKMARLAYG
jgi:transposase